MQDGPTIQLLNWEGQCLLIILQLHSVNLQPGLSPVEVPLHCWDGLGTIPDLTVRDSQLAKDKPKTQDCSFAVLLHPDNL